MNILFFLKNQISYWNLVSVHKNYPNLFSTRRTTGIYKIFQVNNPFNVQNMLKYVYQDIC